MPIDPRTLKSPPSFVVAVTQKAAAHGSVRKVRAYLGDGGRPKIFNAYFGFFAARRGEVVHLYWMKLQGFYCAIGRIEDEILSANERAVIVDPNGAPCVELGWVDGSKTQVYIKGEPLVFESRGGE